MPQFQPINTAHAIAEMVVFIGFNQPLAMDQIELSRRKLIEQYSQFRNPEELHTVQFEIGQSSRPSFDTCAGYIFKASNLESNKPEWIIRLSKSDLSIHCLEYSRWKDISKEALSYASIILENQAFFESAIATVGLKYIDRFLFEGDASAYDLNKLLNPHSQYLTEKAFDSGPVWHQHTGWLMDKQYGTLLNQLSIDSTRNVTAENKYVISLDHSAVLLADSNNPTLFKLTEPTCLEKIERLLEEFHLINKEVLLTAFSQETLDRLNLRPVASAPL